MSTRRDDVPGREPAWASWPDKKLLDLRFCDLKLSIAGTALETRIQQLRRELHELGFKFKPSFWISTEWFTPDGVPGCAVPFYLIHPRLAEVEMQQVGEVEGGTAEWCMRILRHETGHAIDNAFHLRRRKRRQALFGSSKVPYPEFYEPRPYSRSYVLHIEPSYAQSHPDEDFAETFAVWMTPHSDWRQRYAARPVIKKLEYMDELMTSLRGVPPINTRRKQVESLRGLTTTLREHYAERRERFGAGRDRGYDRDLKKLFPRKVADPTGPDSADRFIAALDKRGLAKIKRWTGERQYLIANVLADARARCRHLGLGVDPQAGDTRENFLLFLTAQTVKYVLKGRNREWL
jgi:hypothetical protein